MKQAGKVFQIGNQEVWFCGHAISRGDKILCLGNKREKGNLFTGFLVLTGLSRGGAIIYRSHGPISKYSEEYMVDDFFEFGHIQSCK